MQTIKELLSEAEFAEVTRKSNLLGFSKVIFDWTVICGTFYLTAQYPNPLTIVLAIFILGARQLGLGVIVHETGHRTLLTSPALNDFVGNWLAGYWVFSDKAGYMRAHLQHHQKAGTEDDPDLPNYRDYPITRERLRRKLTRDLTGQVGWRRLKSIARSIRRLPELKPATRQYVIRSLGVNLLMLTVLALTGHAWLYALWVIAFITTHMMVTRIRQIAEHAAVPDLYSPDPRLNTRTLYISPLERLFIAPHQVNYHLEHHMIASVPIYRLQRLHELLRARGYYDDVEFHHGYVDLLRYVTGNDNSAQMA
ncbi:MAG: fatty acid desaturase family protein [Pseudomonadales bacterium]|nr:fatty acid desaturase family protein [Pseudomonadales bacterium]